MLEKLCWIVNLQLVNFNYYLGLSQYFCIKVQLVGGMARIHMSLDKMMKRLPDGVFAAIKNHDNSVTVSGNYEKVNELVNQLKTEGHPIKSINSAGVAFHSPCLQNVSEEMRKALLKVIIETIFVDNWKIMFDFP